MRIIQRKTKKGWVLQTVLADFEKPETSLAWHKAKFPNDQFRVTTR